MGPAGDRHDDELGADTAGRIGTAAGREGEGAAMACAPPQPLPWDPWKAGAGARGRASSVWTGATTFPAGGCDDHPPARRSCQPDAGLGRGARDEYVTPAQGRAATDVPGRGRMVARGKALGATVANRAGTADATRAGPAFTCTA
jgi:hypothetical protein